MYKILIAGLLLFLPIFSNAQTTSIDSLTQAFKSSSNASHKYQLSRTIYFYYENTNSDSAHYYLEAGLQLARKNNKYLAEANVLISRAYQLIISAQYAASLQDLLKAFSIIEHIKSENNNWILNDPEKAKLLTLSYAHHTYANLMTPTQNAGQQIYHYKQALHLSELVQDPMRRILANLGLGRTYMDLNRIDSALIFEQQAERISLQSGYTNYLSAILSYSGLLHLKKGEPELALQHFYRGIEEGIKSGNRGGLAQNYYHLTNYYLIENQKDSALLYAVKFERLMEILGSVSLSTVNKGMAYENLYKAYELNNEPDSAYKYLRLALITNSRIFQDKINSLSEFQNLSFQEQMRLQNMERENEAFQNRILVFAMLSGLLVITLVSLILYRNNKQKHKANKILEDTISNLKSAQAQLIQAEKMASLGELTAGIAHEIQNPLNFVNNFSEVSSELVEELREGPFHHLPESAKEEAAEIMGDLKQNLQKIHHHGQRADAIVKNMLQHSRTTAGEKQLTNLNNLADEYLRLAYHGLRSKDKSFTCTLDTFYDLKLEKVEVVPQDIGRVLLNLFNNAFYAVQQRQKLGQEDYQPTVTVSTHRQEGQQVEIRVRDNGTGMPESVKQKIFQPFFTTKPTGQGTGLGLSLSYDIIKGHGGELQVESVEGEFTEFMVQLPVKQLAHNQPVIL
jgi:two-component system, NtrC family, sensor kinase